LAPQVQYSGTLSVCHVSFSFDILPGLKSGDSYGAAHRKCPALRLASARENLSLQLTNNRPGLVFAGPKTKA
jgi:hypothetical protein